MSRKETVIVEITATSADISIMNTVVEQQTGDGNPIYCPPVIEGEPYQGHAHTFPPSGVVEPSVTPIHIGQK